MPTRHLLALALVAATAACTDATSPRRDVTLTFCNAPKVVALLNDDGSWSKIAAGSASSVTVSASDKVGLALAYDGGQVTSVFFYFIGTEQAVRTFSCPSVQDPGNKTVNASVAGLGVDEFGMVATPGNAHFHVPSDFQLCCLPPKPIDIIAWKQHEPATGLPSVPRIILRRDQNPADGATLPVFDFGSAEAFEPVEYALNVTGAPAGTLIFAQTYFLTSTGVDAAISVDSTSGTALLNHSVPASRLAAGDLHLVNVLTTAGRDVTVAYHTPSNLTLSVGPAVNLPAFTAVAAQALPRVHMDMATQPDYGAQIDITMLASDGHVIEITGTREYFGTTSSAWSVTIPDLSAIPEFGASWSISAPFTWSALVSSQPWGFHVGDARDGDVFRTAHLVAQSQPALSVGR